MNNKEVLQNHNTKLNTNNANLNEVLDYINNLPSSANLQEKEITENGEYTPDEGYDGFNKVNVNVEGGGGIPKESINPNEMYTQGYNKFKNILIELPSMDLSDVKSFVYMFAFMTSLKKADLSSSSPQNITSMSYMFQECAKLEDVIFGNFNTSNVTSIAYMFKKCYALKNFNMSHLDFSKVTTASNMFESVRNDIFDLSYLRLPICTNFYEMFISSWAKKIDLRNLTMASNANIGRMFYGCGSLEELYLDNFDMKASKSFDSMFYGTNANAKIYVKDAENQNWVLTASNGHPAAWTTNNVIIAGSEQDLRGA